MMLPLVALMFSAGPCDPIVRVAADAPLAGVYAKVAQEEEDRGAREESAAAWRRAAELEPAGGAAEQALGRLCARAKFDEGEALFKQHDCKQALPLLHEARGGPDDASAALLEGICGWELGDDALALAALTAAGADPELAPTAELFLGLLALRQGDSRGGLARIRGLGGSDTEGLRSTAAELLRVADRRERLIFDLAAEGGYDSNASLIESATVIPGGADDAFGAATGSITLRPLLDNGPFLLVGGGYRKYARVESSDVGLATGRLGWELALARVRGSLDYGVDFVEYTISKTQPRGSSTVARVPWMLRQGGTLRVVVSLSALLLSAEYALGHEQMLVESALPDTGFRNAGRLSVGVRLGAQLLELSAVLSRLNTATSPRRFTEAGGELRWLIQPSARVDLEAAVGVRGRVFDTLDPELGVTRRELQVDARVGGELELQAALRLFALVEGHGVSSSVAALNHTRIAASAGLRFSMGVW